jgi:hypothetical protein
MRLALSSENVAQHRHVLTEVQKVAETARTKLKLARDSDPKRIWVEFAVACTIGGGEMRLDEERREDPAYPKGRPFLVARVFFEVEEGFGPRSLMDFDGLQVPSVEFQDPTPWQDRPDGGLVRVLAPLDEVRIVLAEVNRLSRVPIQTRILPPSLARDSWRDAARTAEAKWTKCQRVVSVSEDLVRTGVLEKLINRPDQVELWPAYGGWLLEVAIPRDSLEDALGTESMETMTAVIRKDLQLRVLMPALIVD